MAMVRCRECGKEISSEAKACPHCGAEKPVKKDGCLSTLLVILSVFFGLIIINGIFAPSEKKDPAEEKRKGFHCLSSWDGSNQTLVKLVQENLKDPDSFEHIETRVTPVKDGRHSLTMKYRAKNSFGGYVVGNALASMTNEGCDVTVISTE